MEWRNAIILMVTWEPVGEAPLLREMVLMERVRGVRWVGIVVFWRFWVVFGRLVSGYMLCGFAFWCICDLWAMVYG